MTPATETVRGSDTEEAGSPMQVESYGRSRGQRGQLTTLPDGSVRARYWDVDGKRPQRTFAKGEKRRAAQWLREKCEEVERIRNGEQTLSIARREANRTVEEACRDYLAAHEAEESTIAKLRGNLRLFERAFAGRRLQSIEAFELQGWRQSLPEKSRADRFKAVRQLYRQAVAWKWLIENVAADVPNPQGPGPVMRPFPWEAVYAVTDEIDLRYQHVPILAAGTGMRPQEWIALEWRCIDFDAMLISVERVFSFGRVRELGSNESAKHKLQRRKIPMRAAVAEALSKVVRRIDTPLVTPGPNGHINLASFRTEIWRPTCIAAGVVYQRPYDMRHTYATDSIAAGIDLFTLSRRMGTSIKEIDKTYGHLLPGAEERERELLDALDVRRAAL